MNRLIKASDYNVRAGAKSVRQRIQILSGQLYRRGLLETPFRDEAPRGKAVMAEVNHGQWLAFCECRGCEAVDYEEPIFYCFNCGNRGTGGWPRPVTFPNAKDRMEIERLLLERPVDESAGANEIDRAFMAKARVTGYVGDVYVVLERTWKPSESVYELRKQNQMIKQLIGGRA